MLSIAAKVRVRQNVLMTLFTRARALTCGAVLALLAAACRAAAPGPGDMPPSDIGVTLSGDRVLLANYSGKAVIVTFWATWCPYCLKELPVLENVQNKAGKDRIAVIAVNTEERDVFRRVTRIMNKSMRLEFVSDASGGARAAFGVNGLPHMVIIGRDGRIIKVYEGYSESKLHEVVADINQALAPAP